MDQLLFGFKGCRVAAALWNLPSSADEETGVQGVAYGREDCPHERWIKALGAKTHTVGAEELGLNA